MINLTKGKPSPWGRDDLMAVCAVRYCLGRMTYIVGECREWLEQQWPHLSNKARAIIQLDIETEFKRDDEARANGSKRLPLGWECDRAEWEKVRRLWLSGHAEDQAPR